MALREYKRKRKFPNTPEPAGGRHQRPVPTNQLFVIQKHAARRLHYDLRFEAGGVLKSWAVPKGLPLRHSEKHLAIHVEDHPLDYAMFEGVIPQGNYGAGSVMVWDIGTYEIDGANFNVALREGRIHFTLHGKKLNGEWSLVRMHSRNTDEKEQWLIIRHGANAKPISATRDDSSALSRKSMKRIAAGNGNRSNTSNASLDLKGTAKERPGFVAPMKALLAERPPNDTGWIHEIKFDGMRAIAVKNSRSLQLFSRSHRNITHQFPAIATALRELPCSQAVFDGEIVALDSHGRSSFQLLQPYMQAARTEATTPVLYYLFDLPNYKGRNIRQLPIESRKEILSSLLPRNPDPLRFSADLRGRLPVLLKEVRRRGLEGIIAKRRGSAYETDRRSGAWIKLKTVLEQEFVIGGYTPPKGSREHFGALLVGYYENSKLRFASKVGTGFDSQSLRELYGRFQKVRTAQSPFADLSRSPSTSRMHNLSAEELKKCIWLRPKLVAQIRFSEWTNGAGLRQPVFLGLREDKAPRAVHRETPLHKKTRHRNR